MLKKNGFYCIVTLIIAILFTIPAWACNAKFTTKIDNNAPLTATFNALKTKGGICEWDFGDGSPKVTGKRFSHTYKFAGTYVVTLRLAGSEGCETVKTKTVKVKGKKAEHIPGKFGNTDGKGNEHGIKSFTGFKGEVEIPVLAACDIGKNGRLNIRDIFNIAKFYLKIIACSYSYVCPDNNNDDADTDNDNDDNDADDNDADDNDADDNDDTDDADDNDDTDDTDDNDDADDNNDTNNADNGETVLSNGYKITFLDVVYNENNTSSWSYSVEELPNAKDLSHWVLGLPECVTVVDGSPDFYETADPDPTTGVSGIKWDTDDEFKTGEFTVVADGYWNKGVVKVAGKGGTNVGIGEITGPVCVQPSDTDVNTDDNDTDDSDDSDTDADNDTGDSDDADADNDTDDSDDSDTDADDDTDDSDDADADNDTDDSDDSDTDADDGTNTDADNDTDDSDADNDTDDSDDSDTDADDGTNTDADNDTDDSDDADADNDTDDNDDTDNTVTVLPNGYKITFLDMVCNEDNTSAWRYSVEELPDAEDLSHWVLELPECVTAVGGSPDFYEIADPDPKTGVSGVKWDVNDKFKAGEFTVVTDGYPNKGAVKIAGKGGTDVGIGKIYGPVCP